MSQPARQKAAIYVRVSSVAQLTGTSPMTQEADLRRVARERGYDVVDLFVEEGVSGRTTSRPALSRLREAAEKKGFAVLLVLDVTRFSRSARDSLILAEEMVVHGIRIEDSKGHSTDDKLTWTILSAVAEHESDRMRERVSRGRLARGAEGKWTGGKPPFGTRIIPSHDDRGAILVEQPAEADAIREAALAIVDDGATTGDVARRWNGQGLPSPRGRRWGHATVRRLLQHPRLAGRFWWGGHETQHPEIVSPPLFERIQKVLATRSNRHAESRKYLLSGRIVCPCGETWVGAGSHGKGSGRKHYYRCSNNRTGCHYRDLRYLPADAVEDLVWDLITGWGPPRLREAVYAHLVRLRSTSPTLVDDIPNIRLRVADLRERRVTIVGDYAAAGIDPDVLKKALEPVEEDLQAETERLAQAEALKAASDPGRVEDLLAAIYSTLQDMAASEDHKSRHAMIESLDLRVHLGDEGEVTLSGSLSTGGPEGRTFDFWDDHAFYIR